LDIKRFFILVIIGAMGIETMGLNISGNITKKEFNRFSTKNSRTRDIAHNKEGAAIWNSKIE
jgi:hypothetical protein